MRATDVLIGRGTAGPYPLTWKKIRSTGVLVQVDNVPLSAEGFLLDAQNGTIVFKTPLKPSSIARVAYDYERAAGQRNAPGGAAALAAPVSVPLLSLGPARLQVTALPAGENGTARFVWGLSNPRLGSSGFSSQLLLDAGGSGGESLADCAGVTLGYKTGWDQTRIEADFARAGKAFAAGDALGLAKTPEQRWSLGLQTRASRWVGAVSMNETRDLAGGGAAAQSAISLRLSDGSAPTVSLLRDEKTKTNAQGEATTVTTEKFALATGALSAQGQRVATDGPAAAKDQTIQETSVALASGTLGKTPQAALVTVTDFTRETATGVEAKQGVSLVLQPASMLRFSAETRTQTSDPADPRKPETEITLQTARAELEPLPGALLSGAVRVVGTVGETEEQSAVTEVSARLKPLRYLELSGGRIDRAGTGEEDLLNTTRAMVSLKPLPGWSLSGVFTLNPEEQNKVAQATRQEFGLAGRVGALELSGGYKLTTLADAGAPAFGEMSLSVGLRFSRWTRLTGGYRNAFLSGMAADPAGTRLYSLGLTHNLGTSLNFSLGGSVAQNEAQPNRPDDIKAEAKLGVKF